MAEEDYYQMLDLSRCNTLVRNVLRRLGVETIEKLLTLREEDLLTVKNCGAKTTAKVLELQAEYGKDIAPQKGQEAIDKALDSGRGYMNRLIIVAIAANEVIEGAKEGGRYYFRVTRQRFNTLKGTLKALKKQQ